MVITPALSSALPLPVSLDPGDAACCCMIFPPCSTGLSIKYGVKGAKPPVHLAGLTG